MSENTKQLFEALTLLRYASEHNTNDISKEEIQNAYYKIFDLISQLKQAEDFEQIRQQTQQEQQNVKNRIHQAIIKNFDNKGAVEIANDISNKMAILGIQKSYIVFEMSNGEIGIIEGTDAKNKQVIRTYTDYFDYIINIDEDLKCNFQREKLFSNPKKLKKGDHE